MTARSACAEHLEQIAALIAERDALLAKVSGLEWSVITLDEQVTQARDAWASLKRVLESRT